MSHALNLSLTLKPDEERSSSSAPTRRQRAITPVMSSKPTGL